MKCKGDVTKFHLQFILTTVEYFGPGQKKNLPLPVQIYCRTDHLYRDLVDISDSVYLIYDPTAAKKIRDHAELKEYGCNN